MKVENLMRPFSDQPKPGQKVKAFLSDGAFVFASCCQVDSENFSGLQWYDTKTGDAIDVNKISGWMPIIRKR